MPTVSRLRYPVARREIRVTGTTTIGEPDPRAAVTRTLVGGICTLVVAMGIGRFAYTPLLPGMQEALGIGHPGAGLLASLNYLGYMVGALAAGFIPRSPRRIFAFRAALVASVATTALMAATTWFVGFGVLRLLSGIASGGLFVIGADMVSRSLARWQRSHRLGEYFGGVGLGIAATGMLVPLLEGLGGWRAGWIGLAVVAGLCAGPVWLWLHDDAAPAVKPVLQRPTDKPTRDVPNIPFTALLLAYFLEGFGYIVSGTFLVAILWAEGSGGMAGPLAWTAVGLAAVPSCIVWMAIARRWGFVRALVIAHVLQAAGIAMPVVSVAPMASVAAAMLFGGTFMGITTLVIALAQTMGTATSARAVGLLTAAFGLGQILGPVTAGWLAREGGFDAALVLAAGAVLLGAVVVLLGAVKARSLTERRQQCPM